MSTATVTSKGQITIPAELRARLRLLPGTRIDFVENDRGETVLRPKTRSVTELRGFIKYDGPPRTLEEIDQGIADAVGERDRRSKS